jgi:hypothetical protein
MDPVPSIEKPSRVLKNSSGLDKEIQASVLFHSVGMPILVSGQLLRARDMGQIDLARLRKDDSGWLIEVQEVKSSTVGEEMLLRGQRNRLISSMNFLSGIFGARIKFALSSQSC